MIIKELLARLGFEVDDKGLKEFNQVLGEAAKGMAVVVGAGVAAAATVTGLAVATANAGDQAAKGAQRAGVTVEEYQKLSFAAEKAGVSQQQLEASLKLANTQMQKAAQAGQDYIETSNGVQIAIKNADGSLKTQTELMEETANAVQDATSATDKLAIATSVYGSVAGARMVPLLELGADGIARLGEEAEALGIVMSEEAAARSEEFLDSITDMQAIATGLRNIIGEQLIPVLLSAATIVREWFLANSDIIRQRLEHWARVLAEAVDGVIRAVTFLIEVFTEFRAVGAATLAALLAGAVALGVALTATGILPLWAAFAIVIIQVLAIWTALALVIEDVVVFFQGGTSALGIFVERFREADGILGSIARLFSALREFGLQVFEMLGIVSGAFAETGTEGEGAMSTLADMVLFLLEKALIPLSIAIDAIALGIQGVTAVMQALEPIAARVWGTIANIVGAAGDVAGLVGGLGGGAAPASAGLAPAGAAAPTAGAGGGNTTINQTTHVHGGSREEIEDAVDGKATQRNRASLSEYVGAEV